MTFWIERCCVALLLLPLGFGAAQAQLRGHGGPVRALASSPDGKLVAAAGIRGSVAIIERKARKLVRTLVGPGLPVWSVAFFPDNHTLLTGGTDRTIRRSDAVTGEPVGGVAVGAPDDPLAAYANNPGAQVFRACVACHTSRRTKSTKRGRVSPTFLAARSRRCQATAIRTRSST